MLQGIDQDIWKIPQFQRKRSNRLANSNRESILKLQAAIRETRERVGLPKEGPLRQQQFLDALRGKPPIQQIVGYVKKSLEEDPPLSVRLEGFKPAPRRFERTV